MSIRDVEFGSAPSEKGRETPEMGAFRPHSSSIISRFALGILLMLLASHPALGLSQPDLASAQNPPAPDSSVVFGHGGYAALAPENTMAAIDAAVDEGFPRLWLDVRASADGTLFLLRDETLDRTSDCEGEISSMSDAALQGCDMGSWFDAQFSSERIPRLDAALGKVPSGAQVLIELHAGSGPALRAAIDGAGLGSRAIVISSDAALLSDLESGSPRIKTRLRLDSLDPREIEDIEAAGIGGIAVSGAEIDVQTASAFRKAGLDMVAAPIASESEMYTGLATGFSRMGGSRLEGLAWASGLAFLSYGPEAFGMQPANSGHLGHSLAVGDFNGEGTLDLAIGAPESQPPGVSRRMGWVGVSQGLPLPSAIFSQYGEDPDGRWGEGLLSGDFNGDDVDDLVVASPYQDFSGSDSGIVWLWDGSAAGIGRLRRPFGPAPAGTKPHGNRSGQRRLQCRRHHRLRGLCARNRAAWTAGGGPRIPITGASGLRPGNQRLPGNRSRKPRPNHDSTTASRTSAG